MTEVVQIIKLLVGRGVRHLEALEVLAVMAAQPERLWSYAAICADRPYRSSTITLGLKVLVRSGAVACVAGGGEFYRVQGDVDRAHLRAFAAVYKRDRLRVTNTFFACNLDMLRDLSAEQKRCG